MPPYHGDQWRRLVKIAPTVPHRPLDFLLLTTLVELSKSKRSAAQTPWCNSFKLLYASDHIPDGIDERGAALAYYCSEPYKKRPGGQENTSGGGWSKHLTIVVHGLAYEPIGTVGSAGQRAMDQCRSRTPHPQQCAYFALSEEYYCHMYLVDPSLTCYCYRSFQTWTNARHMPREPKLDPCGTCTKAPGSCRL